MYFMCVRVLLVGVLKNNNTNNNNIMSWIDTELSWTATARMLKQLLPLTSHDFTVLLTNTVDSTIF